MLMRGDRGRVPVLLEHTLSPTRRHLPPRLGGVSAPCGRVITMSTSDLPQPALDAAQRAAAALSQMEPIRAALDALGRSLSEQAAALNAGIQAQQERLGRQWAEWISQALAVSLPSLQNDLNQAAEALARTAAQQIQALGRIELTFDTTGLDRILQSVEAWHTLDAGQRTTATQVLDDAYRSADLSREEVSDDLVAGLEETARDFTLVQNGFLTPELQRQAFVYFCGLLMLLVLMQASFTSDTADAVIEKTVALSPAAVLMMVAAGKAWDRFMPRPEETGDDAADEGDGN